MFIGGHLEWWILPAAAIVTVINFALIFSRGQVDHPGLIQVRLNHRTCVQYGSLSGPSAVFELVYANVWLILASVAAGFCVAWEGNYLGTLQFWIWFPLLLAGSIAMGVECRRFRRSLKQVPDRAIADRNQAFHKPVSWKTVSSFLLRPESDDTHRLRILTRRGIFSNFPIDAEIRCTAAQARELRPWLTERLSPAAKTASRNSEA